MKLLVTGGAGFIGSNFIHFMFSFLEEIPDLHIVNLDKLTYAGRKENLKGIKEGKNYSFILGDITNEKDVAKAMKECNAVIHFAAESHVDRSIKDPLSFMKTDVIGTAVLLEQARKQDIERFIYISTDEVYGSVEKGFSKESDPLSPRSPYSASKAAADHLSFAFYHTYGLPVIVHRAANNYGPRQFPEKLIPLFITNLLEGKKVPLYGTGKNIRDWLYVEDNCSAIKLLLEKGKIGEAYNVGSGNLKTNLEVTKAILKLLKKNESFIEFVEDRKGHDKRYALNFDKIKALGWKPKVNFNEGLKKTIEWYKANVDWWKPLKVIK